MPDAYDLAFQFWGHLSEERADLPGGRALANLTAPLLLSNAAWYPGANGLDAVTAWYEQRNVTPALVTPALRSATLDEALQESKYRLEHRFRFRPLGPTSAVSAEIMVEQVSWAQSRSLGELLAAHYGLPEYGVMLGKTLGRAMQDQADILGFLAYADDSSGAVGALIAFETPDRLAAMMLGGQQEPLEQRLAAEAGERGVDAVVLEPLPAATVARDEQTLERWSMPER